MATTVLVVNEGHAIYTNRMIGVTPAQAEPKYMGWGTGTGVAGPTDTTLFVETSYSGYARAISTTSAQTVNIPNDTYQLVGTFINTTLGTLNITNVGTFDAATLGNLFVKASFNAIPLDPNNSITFTISITND